MSEKHDTGTAEPEMRFTAVKKWKCGGETTMEYFSTQAECLAWIAKQRQPVGDEFVWCVGEY